MSIPHRIKSFGMRFTLIVSCIAGSPKNASSQEEAKEAPRSASGYNNQRLEQEDRYVVPPEKAEELWKYMVDTYVNDTARLKELDPQFTSYFNDEDFTDTYFDTPQLDAYKQECGVRYRIRFNRTNPNDVKNGRQLLQIKSNGGTGNALERGEVKFPINPRGKLKDAEDKHPLIGLVEPDYRPQLKDYLAGLKLDATQMKPILTIQDFRRRLYIRRDDKPFMSVSLDIAESKKLWATGTVIEVEPELNEIVFTEADESKRRYMESISAKIVADLRAKFPEITRDLAPKYNRMFQQFEAQIPMLRFATRLGDDAIAGILGGTLLLLIGIGWSVHRWWRRRRESGSQWSEASPAVNQKQLSAESTAAL